MAIVGIGIDVIEIERIRQAVQRLGERFLKRIYTPIEIEYCEHFKDPIPHLAARFAAKEAAMKALGVGLYSGIPWTDYEIRNEPSGEPRLYLHRRALDRARDRGASRGWVSLSHNRTQAVAVVVMECE